MPRRPRGFTPLSTRFALREGDDTGAAGRPLRGVPELEHASFIGNDEALTTSNKYPFFYAALSLPCSSAYRL